MCENPIRFFDDDGTEINPDLISKPAMCTTCAKDDMPEEEHLCILTRFDQQDEGDFHCEAYESKTF